MLLLLLGLKTRFGRAPQGARGLKLECAHLAFLRSPSRPARGAWVEICFLVFCVISSKSRPARGAWVEMLAAQSPRALSICRAPQGARGLKSFDIYHMVTLFGRAPQGARGLKYQFTLLSNWAYPSRPARGAWVEISPSTVRWTVTSSRPARGAWVEIGSDLLISAVTQSRPARGAWVEIAYRLTFITW